MKNIFFRNVPVMGLLGDKNSKPISAVKRFQKQLRPLGVFCLLTPIFALSSAPVLGQTTVKARRPSLPYRVWYGLSGYPGTASIYPNASMATTGDTRALEANGKSGLGWVYGSQIPDWNDTTTGWQYWSDRCGVTRRTIAADTNYSYDFLSAGIGIDEFANTSYPNVWSHIAQGLRTGKQANKDVYIAAWLSNTVRSEIFDLGKDGTIDLYLVQGYTHSASAGNAVGRSQAIARLEVFKEKGLINKTLLGMGHITDMNDVSGKQWTEAELRSLMEEVKRKFPEMPGIAFFNAASQNTTNYNNLAQLVDQLSAEYWPTLPLRSGIYAVTPQVSTFLRLDAAGSSTANGTKVTGSTSTYPASSLNQKWRFTHLGSNIYRIQPAYSSAVSLDVTSAGTANGTKVQLYANNTTNAQKWQLTSVVGGFKLSPLNAPSKYLRLSSGTSNTQLDIWDSQTGNGQVFGITPEFSSLEPISPVYQAESQVLGGGAYVSNQNSGSVGGYVGFTPSGSTLTFYDVDGGAGGNKQLSIRYSSGFSDTRNMNLTVNGVSSIISFPPTAGWTMWERLNVTRNLNAGTNNTIVLSSIGVSTPGIDKLTRRTCALNLSLNQNQDSTVSTDFVRWIQLFVLLLASTKLNSSTAF